MELFGTTKGIKNLEFGVLKTTYPMKINDRDFGIGEVVVCFEKPQIALLEETLDRTNATGGKGNRSLVSWVEQEELNFEITMGKLNPFTLSLLTGNKQETQTVRVPAFEEKTSSPDGEFSLQHTPLEEELFIYDVTTQNAVLLKENEYVLQGNVVVLNDRPSTTVFVSYYYEKVGNKDSIIIERTKIGGYFRFEGKAIYKDSNAGVEKEVVFIMPRVRLETDLGITLSKESAPTVYNLVLKAEPVKVNKKYVSCEIHFL